MATELAERRRKHNTLTKSGPSSDELWTSAAALLNAEDKERIDFKVDKNGLNVEEVLAAAQQKKQDCLDDRWNFEFRGKKIYIRDLCSKIVESINKVQSTVDFAVSMDVSGHAALPWAGVKFFLQLATDNVDTFGKVLVGMDFITRTISYFVLFEANYLRRPSESTDHLTAALVKTYAKILEYLALSKRYYTEHTFTRSFRTGQEKFDAITGAIEKMYAETDHWARLIDGQQTAESAGGLNALRSDTKQLKETMADLRVPLTVMSTQLIDLHDHLEKSNRKEILNWVSAVPYKQHHENTRIGRLPGSGKWLLSHETFLTWKFAPTSSILWLSGIPGSGKTVLSSLVIDDLLAQDTVRRNVDAVVYFYCAHDPSMPARSDQVEVLRSTVLQMACPTSGGPVREEVIEKYNNANQDGFGGAKLNLDKATELLVELTKAYGTVSIVIDALDEVDPEIVGDLLNKLKEIVIRCPSVIKMFLTSRIDSNIETYLSDAARISIGAINNQKDIRDFVKFEVEERLKHKRLLKGVLDADLKEELTEKLIGGAQGMFKWASLQLQYLCSPKIKDADDLRAQLQNLPKELEDIYAEIYRQIEDLNPEKRRIAETTLAWLLCGKSLIRSQEFLALVVPSSFKGATSENLVELCCNLITHDDNLSMFRFAHLTVREFLDRRAEYTEIECNSIVAESCLEYVVKLRPKHGDKAKTLDYPQGSFHDYAILFWPVHCQLSCTNRSKACLKRLLAILVPKAGPAPRFATWMTEARRAVYHLAEDDKYSLGGRVKACFSSPPDAVFLACAFDIPELLGAGLSNVKNEEDRTCLEIAADWSAYDVVTLLLERGVCFDGKDRRFLSAVRSAAFGGGFEVLELILSAAQEFHIDLQTLKIAVAGDNHEARALKCLLDADSEFQLTNDILEVVAKEKRWPGARYHPRKEHLELLLDRDEGIEISDRTMQMDLRSFDEDSLTRLLSLHPEKTVSEEILEAVVANAYAGASVIETLLARYGQACLSDKVIGSAVRQGSKEIVETLLRYYPETPVTEAMLVGAASNESSGEEVVKFILENVDLPVTRSMLLHASANESCGETIMKILLDRDPNQKIGSDMIKSAARCGSIENLEFMLLQEQLTPIDDDISQAAMETFQAGEIIRTLLRYNSPEAISESVLMGAVNSSCTNLTGFKELYARRATATQPSKILAAALNEGYYAPAKVRFLLSVEEAGAPLQITEELLKSAASCSNGLLKLILEHDPTASITEDILVAAVIGTDEEDNLAYLLDRDPSLQVTERVWQAGFANQALYSSGDTLRLLHSRRGDTYMAGSVNEPALKADGSEALRLLLLDPEIKVTDVMLDFLTMRWVEENEDKARALLHIPRLHVERIWEAAASYPPSSTHIQCLIDQGGDLCITDRVIKAARNRGNQETLSLLLQHRSKPEHT